MSEYYGNLLFIGVARYNDRVIVASHAYNSSIDMKAVKEVLKNDDFNPKPKVHFSFAVNGQSWHLMCDEEGRIYIMIAIERYPRGAAYACLEELQRSFIAKCGKKSLDCKEKKLDSTCSTLFLKICQKYDNVNEVDKLTSIKNKVEEIQLTVHDSLARALDGCAKLDEINQQAEDLQAQAGIFKRQARDVRKAMWWKDFKMKLIIGMILLAVLITISAVIWVQVESAKKATDKDD